jgi:hypothetical protein
VNDKNSIKVILPSASAVFPRGVIIQVFCRRRQREKACRKAEDKQMNIVLACSSIEPTIGGI